MENDNKVKSWDLGEPNSDDMLEMGDQSFVICGGGELSGFYFYLINGWFKINLGVHAHNMALPLLSGPSAIKSKLIFFPLFFFFFFFFF